MKVMLINTSSFSPYVSEAATYVSPPTGLAYIAAVLEKNNYDVRILDVNALGMNVHQVKEEILREDADIAGITATTPAVNSALDLARAIKEVKPSITVVFGGPHPTALPRELLLVPDVDVVVYGEGEITMSELCDVANNSLESVRGIYFKRNGVIHATPPRPLIQNLDEMPFPLWHLLPLEKYWTPGVMRTPWLPILTSRGCPYQCIYCNKNIFGYKFRARSAENVLAEIDYFVGKYEIKEFDIIDDTFSLIPKRVEEICDGLVERNYDLIWRASNGLRVDNVTKDLLRKMKRAGCRFVAFGVESGCQDILNNIRKGITLDEVRSAFKWCREVGITTVAFFMIGNPGETEKTIRRTMAFAKELKPDYAQFTITVPYPGTELYKLVSEKGKMLTSDWSKYGTFSEPVYELGELTPDLMKKMQRLAYKEFYLRPTYVAHELLKIRSFIELTSVVKKGIGTLKLIFQSNQNENQDY